MSGTEIHFELTTHVEIECERCKGEMEIIATPSRREGRVIIVAPCEHCVADAEGSGWHGLQMHELPPVGDPGNPHTEGGGPHEE